MWTNIALEGCLPKSPEIFKFNCILKIIEKIITTIVVNFLINI